MTGRDPDEQHRTATPLELFFDLIFVIAFAQASAQFAHLLAEGAWVDGLEGFGFTMFAVIWAWINFAWFASAFDCDDWIYRLLAMVQMMGVMIIALGVPEVFATFHEGQTVHNGTMVLGYVVMRLAVVTLWLRAAHDDPTHRKSAMIYAVAVITAQIGWIALWALQPSIAVGMAWWLVLLVIEMLGPWLAERTTPTPWHAHHIAERHSLLSIIALGECVTGSFLAFQAVVQLQGWSSEVVAIGLAGIGLTFGMWWMYFILPSGEVLHIQRDKGFQWGYGHVLIFAAITATGAGLHVAASYMSHEAHISSLATVLTTVVPVAIFVTAIFGLYSLLVERIDPFHLRLVGITAIVLVAAVALAMLGAPVQVCLLVVMLAPMVTVVEFELEGHAHHERVLAELRAVRGESS